MIYNNQRMERPNPALNLRWTFFSNGTERLYWDRGTQDFCERFAYFQYSNNNLETLVFAVNPRNGLSCSNDPDMKLGVQAKVRLEIKAQELWLYFSLSDETLIYVLKKVESNTTFLVK